MHYKLKLSKRIEYGEVCAICHHEFVEEYDVPKACEECGGDGVLATYANRHQGA